MSSKEPSRRAGGWRSAYRACAAPLVLALVIILMMEPRLFLGMVSAIGEIILAVAYIVTIGIPIYIVGSILTVIGNIIGG